MGEESMGTIQTSINKLYNNVDNEQRGIDRKINIINQTWTGQAQEAFSNAHSETNKIISSIKDDLQSLMGLALNIENSVAVAERDLRTQRETRQQGR